MMKFRLISIGIFLFGLGVAFFSFAPAFGLGGWVQKHFPIQLGLDLQGGTHLVYRADTSSLPSGEVEESMSALRDVIERRVNMFGVSEPLVQTSSGGILAGNAQEERLIVELPGVTDLDQAVAMIGKTPVLVFKTLREDGGVEPDLASSTKKTSTSTATTTEDATASRFESTELTGRYLKGADLRFNQLSGEPIVSLQFNDKGADLFAKITKNNVGQVVAIFLDGRPISTPVVNEPILTGEAVISGNFSLAEAKMLVGRLNAGALPVPIELISSQTIGATLGKTAFEAGVFSGVVGLLLVAVFLILWYRLPGLLAVVALGIYVSAMIAVFKLIPVTITAAGIAGLVLSIGMAVDANVLIFERMKEEIRNGKKINEAIDLGFSRAWLSIRDGNFTTIMSAVILFWFGTSLVEGFALVLGVGVILSMLTAITVTRSFLKALGVNEVRGKIRFLFGSGFTK